MKMMLSSRVVLFCGQGLVVYAVMLLAYGGVCVSGCRAETDGNDSAKVGEGDVLRSPDVARARRGNRHVRGAESRQIAQEKDGRLFAKVLPGWKYWKTLGNESTVVEISLDVASDDESGIKSSGGYVRIAPASEWEITGPVQQTQPKTRGSIALLIETNEGNVIDPEGIEYIHLFENRYLGWGRSRIEFELVGHAEREMRAIPIRRHVNLEWSRNRAFDGDTRVLLRTTEYACVLIVR